MVFKNKTQKVSIEQRNVKCVSRTHCRAYLINETAWHANFSRCNDPSMAF